MREQLASTWRRRSIAVAVLVAAAVVTGVGGAAKNASKSIAQLYPASGANWAASSGDFANTRYSSLNQINTSNVGTLKVAWAKSLFTPEMIGPNGTFSGIEATPIESGGVLYRRLPNGVDCRSMP